MSRKLIFDCNDESISISLKKMYDYIDFNEQNIYSLEESNDSYIAMVTDFNKYKENPDEFKNIVQCCLKNHWHMIILNVSENEVISKNLGFAVPCKCMVVRNYNDYRVFDILGDENDFDISTSQDCVYKCSIPANNYQDFQNNCIACNNKNNGTFKNNIKAQVSKSTDISHSIHEIISNKYIPPKDSTFSMKKEKRMNIMSGQAYSGPECIPDDAKITDLPRKQYNLFYINLNFSQKISNEQPQIIGNATTLEISLIASYNPPYKYLHVRTLGSGLNPGKLICDVDCCRGWFQNSVDLSIKPDSNDLSIYTNEPKNVNNVNYYETLSRIAVGVQIGLIPSIFPLYEITNKKVTYINDYEVLNKSFGNTGKWVWQLSLTSKKINNIFQSNIIRKPFVKPLPQLAKSNLEPTVDIVWYTDLTFNKTINLDVRFIIQYIKASIEPKSIFGRRFYYSEEIKEVLKSYGTVIALDFDSVSV